MRFRSSIIWGALCCSPFTFAQVEPEYIPPIDVAAPAVVIDDSATVTQSTGEGGSRMTQLFVLTEQLTREVQQLRGIVEEQSFEIRRLQQQRLDDYKDFDRRIAGLSAGDVAASAPATASSVVPAASANVAPVAAGGLSEKEAYRAAYNFVKSREFDKAIPAFKEFLVQFPSGDYAGNAYYWLGELYVLDSDYVSAQASMEALVAQFPDHRKVPDAYYKLAKLYLRLGDDEQAKTFANKIITDYSGKADTLVQLAQEFLKTNYPN